MKKEQEKANRKMVTKLSLVAVAMFGFGYALVPLYDLICDVTGWGWNSETGRIDQTAVAKQKIDESRRVVVEFMGHAETNLPWEFKPMQSRLIVVPGKIMTARYLARNLSDQVVTGQAIPSVVPIRATRYFKKLECFCFSKQTLKPGESKEMVLKFVVNQRLAKDIDTITLSYAFFNMDKKAARAEARVSNKVSDEHKVSNKL